MSLSVKWLPEAAREVRRARQRYALVNETTVRKLLEEMKLAETRIAAMPAGFLAGRTRHTIRCPANVSLRHSFPLQR
jgi:hypothetical protein